MDKYEKILKEICYIIRIRKEYYDEMCKNQTQEPNLITAKLIYDDLHQNIGWLFSNIKEEEEETIWGDKK